MVSLERKTMTKDTKRVAELESGDKVILPGSKGISTISYINRIAETERYEINCLEVKEPLFYWSDTEVTYLGNNKKEEETMKAQKVDCSVFYPYFDALIDKEPELHILDVPSFLKKELTNIYELFEGVLDVTLKEVKTLYFERKMSKSRESARTKKVKDLCIGDRIFFSLSYDGYEGEETITKLQESSDTQIKIVTEQGTEAIFRKDKVVTLVD